MGLFNSKGSPSVFDQYASNNTSSYQPNTTKSIFDSRNDTKVSNNQTNSIFSELNTQEKNYSNFSLVDRMIGIETGSLDNSGEISIAEQYKYKNLDKRVMGGTYNVTITDIYKNQALYAAHMGLITDSFIGNKDKGIKTFDTMTKGSLLDKHNKKEVEKESNQKQEINKGRAWTKKSAWEEESAWHKKSAWEEEPEWKKTSAWKDEDEGEDEGEDSEIKTEKTKKYIDPGKEQTFSSVDKIKEDSKKKLKKTISKNKVGDKKQKKQDIQVVTTTKEKPRFNEDLWLRAKKINMKFGKMIITKDDIENLENGGPLPDELLPYKKLKEKIDKYIELSKDESLTIPKRKEYESRISILRPILLERAINGD